MSTSEAEIRPVLRLQNKLSSGLWVKPTVWLTLLDDSVASDAGAKAFKRHIISKNLFGRVSWSEMGVLFTPSSSPDLLNWAKELGIKLYPVSPLSCGPSSTSSVTRHSLTFLQAWCMPKSKAVVFMDVHTIITQDVRELVGLCSPTNDAAFCGAAAGMDHPAYTIDPNLFVAHPSKRHCGALISRAKEILPRDNDCSKSLLNDYFTQVNRTLLDSRFLSVQGDTRPIHSADESRVVQYSFENVTSPPKAAVIDLLARVDRAVASFESQRAGQIPKRVLYATLLTPAPSGGNTHSTTTAMFKQHHVSKFSWGQIPWENQAIIYTEDAFPEFRQWLMDRGGHVIRVPPLLCENSRDERYKYQFTKLHFWNLTDWDMIVYTDLDTLITGDISKLWSACPDNYNLCTIDEPRYFEKGYKYSSGGVLRRGYTYTNGGVLLVRPDIGFYDFTIEGYRTYQNRTLLCEQDFINFFLTNRRYGNVDPKYNTMGFDAKRTIRFQEGKILHFDLQLVNELYEGVTPAERDFVNQTIVKLDKEGAAFPDPALKSTRSDRDTFSGL